MSSGHHLALLRLRVVFVLDSHGCCWLEFGTVRSWAEMSPITVTLLRFLLAVLRIWNLLFCRTDAAKACSRLSVLTMVLLFLTLRCRSNPLPHFSITLWQRKLVTEQFGHTYLPVPSDQSYLLCVVLLFKTARQLWLKMHKMVLFEWKVLYFFVTKFVW